MAASAPSSPQPPDWARPVSDSFLGPWLEVVDVDFVPSDPQPSWGRWVLASVVSVLGSLAVDALLVAVGEAVFPTTKGFAHFQFADYSKLTVIGVVVACVAWPVVTRLSSRPRRLFLRLAVLVTLVLLLPDVYILVQGEEPRGVVVLMAMHLAIALVTYNTLVRIAPAGGGGADRTPGTRG